MSRLLFSENLFKVLLIETLVIKQDLGILNSILKTSCFYFTMRWSPFVLGKMAKAYAVSRVLWYESLGVVVICQT